MKLKAVLFAVIAAIATAAQAATASEMISVSAELTRDGKTVKRFELSGQNGVPLPYQDLTQIGFVESAVKIGGKWGPKSGTFAEGVSAVFTPRVTSDGQILVKYVFDYKKLIRFDKKMFGDVEVQRPVSEGYDHSSSFTINSGDQHEFTTVNQGVKWQLIIAAARQ